jgi:hypothetical protein
VQRTETVVRLIEDRIAAEVREAARLRTRGLAILWCAVVPLLLLVPVLTWFVPRNAGGWVEGGALVVSVAMCIVVWNIGGHLPALARLGVERARRHEDLRVFLLAVPEEKWPERELLRAVVVERRVPWWPTSDDVDYCVEETEEGDSGRGGKGRRATGS